MTPVTDAYIPIGITRLSHAAFGVRRLSQQAGFYVDTWGLDPVEQTGTEVYLRAANSHHHVLQLRQSATTGLDHLAFEVASPDDLDRAAERLAALGMPILMGPAAGMEPGVSRLLRFRDPEGNVIELVSGVDAIPDRASPRDVAPLSLNHAVLFVTDLARQQRFYQSVLGFRLSDTIGGFMAFLRCNANHHSLGLIGLPGSGLQHAAFDVRDRHELARGVFRMGDGGYKRVHGPGRHGPGNMLFSYFQDPEGNVVEYCAEVAQVDDATHTPRNWPADAAMNQWRTPDRPGPPHGLEWTMHLLPLVQRARRLRRR